MLSCYYSSINLRSAVVSDYGNGNDKGSSNEYRYQGIIIETAKAFFHNKLLNQSVNRTMAAALPVTGGIASVQDYNYFRITLV